MNTETNIPPYQQRVLDERSQLAERLEKLNKFEQGPLYESLNDIDKNLLIQQGMAMSNYLQVLDQRIKRFNLTKEKEEGQTSGAAPIRNEGPWLFFGEALIFGGSITDWAIDASVSLFSVQSKNISMARVVSGDQAETSRAAIDAAIDASKRMRYDEDYSIRVCPPPRPAHTMDALCEPKLKHEDLDVPPTDNQ